MEYKEREDNTYRYAVSGMKGLIRVLLFICLLIAMAFIARETYKVGYAVFNQVPVESGKGSTVEVEISEDMSVREIGRQLNNLGLLEESPLVFRLQEAVSDYHGKIKPGTYKLKTNMTAEDMLRVMSGAEEDTGSASV